MKKYTGLNTALWIGLTALGVYVGVKNHKRDGFWTGVLASALIFGISVTVSKGKN